MKKWNHKIYGTDRFYYKVVKEVCNEVKEELIQEDITQKDK